MVTDFKNENFMVGGCGCCRKEKTAGQIGGRDGIQAHIQINIKIALEACEKLGLDFNAEVEKARFNIR
jgi:hypothetical protein